MIEKPQIMTLASSLAAHAATRQSVISLNIANADTPRYRAKDTQDFASVYRAKDGTPLRQTRTGHIGGGYMHATNVPTESAGGRHQSPNGNNVSLETEMVKSAEVRREHDLAITIFGKTLAILRASIGRR